MLCAAMSLPTGTSAELAAFDRDSGAALADAVTASTALPGLVPAVRPGQAGSGT